MGFEKIGSYLAGFRVAYPDDTRPWLLMRNDDPTKHWSGTLNVMPEEIWMDALPALPPAASTPVLTVYDSASPLYVMSNSHAAPVGFWSYVVVPTANDSDTPVRNIVNHIVLDNDLYRPKLYRWIGGIRTEILPSDGSWWVLCTNTGVLITTAAALPAKDAMTEYELDCWAYVGNTFADLVLSSGFIGTVQDSAAGTIVANVSDLQFESTQFSVTDLGGGSALVALTGIAQQYAQRDVFTYAGGAKVFTLSQPTRVTAAAQYNILFVYVNGVKYRQGIDYNFAGLSPGPVTITWVSPGAPNYDIITGDVIEVIY